MTEREEAIREIVTSLRLEARAAPMWEWADVYADHIKMHFLPPERRTIREVCES